ncbi:MAG: hypothetical protein ACAH80_07945 [Alphaproteobacteria bacterium]
MTKKSGKPTPAERERNKRQFAIVCVVVPLLFAMLVAFVNKEHFCDSAISGSGAGMPSPSDKMEFWKTIACGISDELDSARQPPAP